MDLYLFESALLFDSALFLEHRDLELLDAFLNIVFGIVVLSNDVLLDTLRVLDKIILFLRERAYKFFHESTGCFIIH